MALSKQQLYQKDRKWIWKFALRIIAIVFAWVAEGCVVSMTQRLRISMFSGRNGYDQANMFISPSLLMTLALSVLWNASNIFTTLYSFHRIPFGANLACDILLAFSLLASGIWLCVAATTSYNTLRIYIDGEYTEYCDAITEMIGIAFTFLTA
ncbi:MAG: hypothetical protein Q9203_003041, partial [Teloschistes exilis]